MARIPLVEDDRSVRKLARAIFQQEGHDAEKRARRSNKVFSYFVKPYDPEGLVAVVKEAITKG